MERVKNYHLMEKTGTYERIIATAKEEKTSTNAKDVFKLFQSIQPESEKEK